jgi:hypothetical protein
MRLGCNLCFKIRYYATGAFIFAEAMLALLWVGVTIRTWEERASPFYHFTALYFTCFQLINLCFNVTIGALIFWEKARRTFFTDRCEDHKYGTSEMQSKESQKWALYFCERMGRVDPGHCA